MFYYRELRLIEYSNGPLSVINCQCFIVCYLESRLIEHAVVFLVSNFKCMFVVGAFLFCCGYLI